MTTTINLNERPRITPPALALALDHLVTVARGMDELGPMQHLTCTEAEALAGVLSAAGHPDLAASLIDAHALGDDGPGDLHQRRRLVLMGLPADPDDDELAK